jgi:hypothetical protein
MLAPPQGFGFNAGPKWEDSARSDYALTFPYRLVKSIMFVGRVKPMTRTLPEWMASVNLDGYIPLLAAHCLKYSRSRADDYDDIAIAPLPER